MTPASPSDRAPHRGARAKPGQSRRSAQTPADRAAGLDARAVAFRVLRRIESEGAYANLALRNALDRSALDDRDRRFVTDLVYGTTRMRRSCDYLVDRFLSHPPDEGARTALRLGAWQLAFGGVPVHAAVGATVEVAPRRARGLVNAVLRKVATSPTTWPDEPTRLSVPDWIVDEIARVAGTDDAIAALEQMNLPAHAEARDDGYVQDRASQWVAELVEAEPGMLVADLCAAPGGKATALAATGAKVVGADVRRGRLGLIAANSARLGAAVEVVAADAARPPFRGSTFDRILLDAPCTGLGVLRRRPDARWRLDHAAVERLAELQREIVSASVPLLRPDGVLVYSVCTLTETETIGVDDHLATAHPELEPLEPPPGPWRRWGRGALVLPQDAGTDGMFLLRLRR